MSKFLRIGLLSAFYLSQGIPLGFVNVCYVILLSDAGIDNTRIGALIGASSLPWALKIVWGGVIDRYRLPRLGRRRGYILCSQFAMGISLLGLLICDPRRDMGGIAAVLFLHNVFSAMQDVAVDGLAIDILAVHEQTMANGVMVASKASGAMLIGSGGALLSRRIGWPSTILLIVALLWTILALGAALLEEPTITSSGSTDSPRLSPQSLWRSFGFAEPMVGLLIAALTPAGYALTSVVNTRLLRVELGFSESAVGLLSGLVTPLSFIAGAILCGVLARRAASRTLMIWGLVGVALSAFVFAAFRSHWRSMHFQVAWHIAALVVNAVYNTAALGFFMSLTNRAVGATQFAVFMAAGSFAGSWAPPLGGVIADRFGVATCYVLGGLISLCTLGLFPFCDPQAVAARFDGTAPKMG